MKPTAYLTRDSKLNFVHMKEFRYVFIQLPSPTIFSGVSMLFDALLSCNDSNFICKQATVSAPLRFKKLTVFSLKYILNHKQAALNFI